MRAISIQVHPNRTSGLDTTHLADAFAAIAAMTELVSHHQFDQGEDRAPYLNFTFGTDHAPRLWAMIQKLVYEDARLRAHLLAASMAMCSSEHGWDDYVILYHYDPAVPVEQLV